MDQEEGSTAVDNLVTQFNTYEDFLDSQITTVDLYYLEDESLARQLVELGYRGTGEVVKREDFEARKAAIEIARLAERTQKKTLTSAGKDLQDNFLKALAVREEDNRNGKVSMRKLNLREPHFQSHTMIRSMAGRPETNDSNLLCFYNWDSHIAVWNSTPNYQVIADNPEGLLFKYQRDRKILNVDPKAQPGDNSTRTPIQTELYIQAVIFDHISRRKT
ncbi:cilia- and flagella-associated protein 299 isoform X4 [Diceros bicornis minor]|uniref:cilia- and flagella-associated protein 299 isoform X4 n=1 Tax=Diceros bicornis minor TaxID=77932 RepID=UPI0026F1A8B8|nr:cilia- and flagella-associated protein 299 isoform X4 [Diceros bicornis minor]